MKYIPQLDSIRALSILLVIISHWFPQDTLLYNIAETINAPNIFFTISGFLITKILISDRLKSERAGIGKKVIFKNFYIKRLLRIFPGYYLLLMIVFIFNHFEKIDYIYYLTFTSNIHIFQMGVWGQITHLWTMAVEEQFYLVWPWVILFVSIKRLPFVMCLFLLTGVISQYFGSNPEFFPILTFTCLDALSLGALLAWVLMMKPELLVKIYPFITIAAIISASTLLLHIFYKGFYYLPNRTLAAITTIFIISYFSINGNKNTYDSFIFRNKLLIQIGKMSYGIYLFHHILLFYTQRPFFHLNKHLPFSDSIKYNHYLFLAENFCLLMIIASLSWKYFEMPIQNLKNRLKTPVLASDNAAALSQ
jgi:peptidoglycan/LPS O-acetylase OafA/YrhL